MLLVDEGDQVVHQVLRLIRSKCLIGFNIVTCGIVITNQEAPWMAVVINEDVCKHLELHSKV